MQRTDIACKRFELQNRSWTMHIDADQHRAFLVLFNQTTCELRGGRGLTRTLQSGEKNHDRWLCTEVERFRVTSENRHQLAVDDFDESLTGRQARPHFFTNGTLTNAIDKRFDDG